MHSDADVEQVFEATVEQGFNTVKQNVVGVIDTPGLERVEVTVRGWKQQVTEGEALREKARRAKGRKPDPVPAPPKRNGGRNGGEQGKKK